MYNRNGVVSKFLQFPFNVMSVIISIIAGSIVVLYVKDKGTVLVKQEGGSIGAISDVATNEAINTIENMTNGST